MTSETPSDTSRDKHASPPTARVVVGMTRRLRALTARLRRSLTRLRVGLSRSLRRALARPLARLARLWGTIRRLGGGHD